MVQFALRDLYVILPSLTRQEVELLVRPAGGNRRRRPPGPRQTYP
jgi:hypothetical protein